MTREEFTSLKGENPADMFGNDWEIELDNLSNLDDIEEEKSLYDQWEYAHKI